MRVQQGYIGHVCVEPGATGAAAAPWVQACDCLEAVAGIAGRLYGCRVHEEKDSLAGERVLVQHHEVCAVVLQELGEVLQGVVCLQGADADRLVQRVLRVGDCICRGKVGLEARLPRLV